MGKQGSPAGLPLLTTLLPRKRQPPSRFLQPQTLVLAGRRAGVKSESRSTGPSRVLRCSESSACPSPVGESAP